MKEEVVGSQSRHLDPQVQGWLKQAKALGLPALETLSPQAARRVNAQTKKQICGPKEPVAQIHNVRIPGPGGEIPLRIYLPEVDAPLPVLVYFHGGGWVLGDLDTHDPLCRALANAAACIVVAVGYRLAPEHKFPAAVDDALAATYWVASNIAQSGGNPNTLAVGGDSAGGTLATVVARRCAQEGRARLVHQGLIYPVTDLTCFDTASYREFASGYLLTKAEMAWFRSLYLNDIKEAAHPDASPNQASDLRGLPPTLILTAEFDPLRDEGEAYAQQLAQAGVAVRCVRYDGMVHGFITMANVIDRARDAIECWARELHGVLNP